MNFGRTFCAAIACWQLTMCVAYADDWPQWMGPHRDGVWRETNVVTNVPAGGLPFRWKAKVDLGYSGPAVAGGRVFVMDYVRKSGDFVNNPGDWTTLDGEERVLCFSESDGALLWQHAYPQPYHVSYPGGPRCTPTVSGDLVYTLGAEGALRCLRVATGELVWNKELKTEYKPPTTLWGFTSHPLVDENLIYVIAGGSGSECVALDRRTGTEVWRSLSSSEPGYCPPTMIEHEGVKQLLIWHPDALYSVNPNTGETFWTVPLEVPSKMSIIAPRKSGDLIYVSAIQNVSALIRVQKDSRGADIVWRGRPKHSIYCSNSTPFLENGLIFGCDIETGKLIGADLHTGDRLWETSAGTNNSDRRSRHGTAFIVKNQDHFLLFTELGDLVFAGLDREGYHERGRIHVLEPTNEAFGRPVVWSHPAFANRRLYARNDHELVCMELGVDD